MDGQPYVFCHRHFSFNGSMSLVMDELTFSIHFYPKTFGVCWLWNANFVSHARSHATSPQVFSPPPTPCIRAPGPASASQPCVNSPCPWVLGRRSRMLHQRPMTLCTVWMPPSPCVSAATAVALHLHPCLCKCSLEGIIACSF